MSDLQAHPAAELFPLLAGAEFDSFKADIEKNGLLEPIWLCEGKILDGRNRYRACVELGIEPAFRDYDGDAPIAFAWSANGARRHLTKSQLAIIATKLLPELRAAAEKREKAGIANPEFNSAQGSDRGSHDGRSNVQAAKMVGIGATLVQRAEYVAQNAPDLLKQVEGGEITVNAAYNKAKNGKPVPTKTHKAVADRIEEIRDLAAQGYRASQIAAEIDLSEEVVRRYARQGNVTLPDKHMGNTHKIDAHRVISTTVYGLEGNRIVFDTIRDGKWNITAEDAKVWHASLGKSIKELNWLRNKLGVIANGN